MYTLRLWSFGSDSNINSITYNWNNSVFRLGQHAQYHNCFALNMLYYKHFELESSTLIEPTYMLVMRTTLST